MCDSGMVRGINLINILTPDWHCVCCSITHLPWVKGKGVIANPLSA